MMANDAVLGHGLARVKTMANYCTSGNDAHGLLSFLLSPIAMVQSWAILSEVEENKSRKGRGPHI